MRTITDLVWATGLHVTRGEELRRRQIRVKGRPRAGHHVRRHRSDELAERGAARVIGEQRPALQPRGELGLQIEPDPERRVAEDIMYDSKLVGDTAVLAPEQRMRFVTRDHPERRERHRPVLAKLGTELRCVAIGAAVVAGRLHSNTKAAARRSTADDLEELRSLTLERPVGPPDGVGRRRRLPREPLGDPLGKLGPQEARRSQHARRRRGLTRPPIDLDLCATPGREHLTRRCSADTIFDMT
jgi:hypothetical protein